MIGIDRYKDMENKQARKDQIKVAQGLTLWKGSRVMMWMHGKFNHLTSDLSLRSLDRDLEFDRRLRRDLE